MADPYRLALAAHELGHAVAWRAGGFEVDEIWIKGHGTRAHGHVWIAATDDDIRTVEAEHAVQAGLLAGREAQLHWCAETGVTGVDISAEHDMTLYQRRRRTRLGRQCDSADVQATARRLVRHNWPTITQLTPVLAKAGRLQPRLLPAPRT
nr:hypothetical protein [Kibdelosporangium sp. MJ126-NF4]CEL19681.1 hypothetical protein [Kibdelosporangium sp. MJ126-NF4]